MRGFRLLSSNNNSRFGNRQIFDSRIYVVALSVTVLLVMALSVFAQAQSDDEIPMRAKRETLGIHFSGTNLAQNGEIRQTLEQQLSFRFDTASGEGTYNLYLNIYERPKNAPRKLFTAPPKTTVYCVRAQLKFPSGELQSISDCIYFEPLATKITKRINGLVDDIVDGVIELAPLTSRIVEVNGGMVYVDMGSEVGLSKGDKLEVLNSEGKKVGLLKAMNINERETEAKIIRGGNMMPGYIVTSRRFLKGGVGLEYTYFTVTDEEGEHQGRQAMLVGWTRQKAGWLAIQFGSGIMDVWNARGMHVIDMEIIASLEVLTDRLFIDIGGGGGLSAYNLKVERPDTTKTIIKGYGSYKGFGGIRIHPTRAFSISFKAVYLDYAVFDSPDQPAIRAGMMYYFKI